jgi:hypothetical protein
MAITVTGLPADRLSHSRSTFVLFFRTTLTNH